MKNQATINKTLRLMDSRIANEIEPVVYADFKVSPDNIDLMETRYAVIIRGIEIDWSRFVFDVPLDTNNSAN